MDIKTQTIHFTADQQLLDFINKKVGKLETFYDKIVDAEVFLKFEEEGGDQIKEKTSELRLNIPGKSLFASAASKNFEEGIDSVVESVRRQLMKHKEKNNKKPA